MLSLKERFDLLEKDLKATPPAFTMSSDLPFAIFRYDPFNPDENVWKVRQELNLLRTRVSIATGKQVHQATRGDPMIDLIAMVSPQGDGLDPAPALSCPIGR